MFETDNVEITVMETYQEFNLDTRRLEFDDVPIRFYNEDDRNDNIIDDSDWQYSE